MASLENLSGANRAIVELILSHEQSYRDVAQTLDMPVARIRAQACEALVALAPSAAERVEEERRAEVADYLLGQQSAGQSETMRAEFARSEPARTWALSTLAVLRDLYRDGTEPRIPGVVGVESPAAEKPAYDRSPAHTAAARPLATPEHPSASRWPILAAFTSLLAVAALVALALVLLDGNPQTSDEAGSAANQAQSIARLELQPRGGVDGSGAALVYQREGNSGIFVKGHLPPTRRGEVYKLWLFNSSADAVPVLTLETSRTGRYSAEGPLPGDYENYLLLDVSREPAEGGEEHSGNSVLQAPLWTRSLARFFGRL